MTLISAVVTSSILTNDTVYLACDSRVNFASDDGKPTSYTDQANKVVIVNDFLVIAYAGDYYKANLAIEAFNKNNIDTNKNIFNVALDISNKLQENFNGKDTSFLIFIKKGKWNVYEVDSNTFIPQPKSVGLHLIGMGEEEQDEFRKAHDQARKEIDPPTIDGLYTIPLLSAFQRCFNQDVNGIVSFFILNKFGISRLGIGANNDGENWILYIPEKNVTTRFVNGNPFGSISTNFKEIKTGGDKYLNDLRQFLQKKKDKVL